MIEIKAKIRSNSGAIPRFFNAEIDYFGLKLIGHDLFRGSFYTDIPVVRFHQSVFVPSERIKCAESATQIEVKLIDICTEIGTAYT
ncbi:MAG: hypothetical protein ACR2QW_17125, partial [bacterium]